MRRMKKWLALLLTACMVLPGTATIGTGMQNVQAAEAVLDDEAIHGKVYVESGSEISDMFDASLRDNTWVFV